MNITGNRYTQYLDRNWFPFHFNPDLIRTRVINEISKLKTYSRLETNLGHFVNDKLHIIDGFVSVESLKRSFRRRLNKRSCQLHKITSYTRV